MVLRGTRGAERITFPDSADIEPAYRGRQLYVVYDLEKGSARVYSDGWKGELSGDAREWFFSQIDPDYRLPEITKEKQLPVNFIDDVEEIMHLDAAVRVTFSDSEGCPYRNQVRTVLISIDDDNVSAYVLPEDMNSPLGERLGGDAAEQAVKHYLEGLSRKE
ncbi:MAG: hypothetical protein J7K54_02890 [Candidatus Aenigmarchaeota archaeon]|nr:hypothetical protein [Candidatus Aenigmarchaeota archaeon]